ncbi:MAG: RNA helicase, partial [Gammaproteobacteria bacterium]|nr:RNA helicase [Gammaproteobacteria bacterium]
GRTARVGKSGHAISLACEDYAMNLMDIEAFTRRSIPTIAISNDLIADLLPPVKMKKSKPPHRQSDTTKPGSGRSRHRAKRHAATRNRTHQQPG